MDFAEHFDGIVNALDEKLKQKITGRRLMAYHTSLLGRRLFSGELPVVWVNVAVPFEIVNCFPSVSIYSEFIGAVLAGAQVAEPFLEKAEAAGFSTDICSYHRALLGASMQGIIPQPVAGVATTCPCDAGVKSIVEVAREPKAPTFIINVPEQATDEGVDYLAKRLEELVHFMAKVTGTPYDRDLLKEKIVKSNKAAELLSQVYRFGQNMPAPYSQKDMKNFQIIMLPLFGTDAGIEIAQTFVNEFSDRVEKGITGIPNEKIRLLWIQNRIQFPNELLDHIEKQYGANVVWDEINNIYWEPVDPDEPFVGLAKRLINSPLGGDLNKRLESLKSRSVEYKIDGAIHPCHWGCRQSLNSRKLFADTLESVNIPMTTLDVDCVDKRSYSPGQLMTRLEAFCEMLK